jgi:hypothetical protein
VDVGSERVMFSAPTIDCRSAEYRVHMVAVLVVLGLYVVGFPAVVVVTLWLQKDSLYLTGDAMNLSPRIRGFLTRWSPLFRMYHPRAWFWLPLVLLRRAAFVLASVWLVQQPAIRFMAFTFLNFGSLLLHQMVLPFDSALINHLETTSYVLLVCLSVLLTGYAPPYSLPIQITLFLLVVPCAACMMAYVLYQQWVGLRTAMRDRKASQALAEAKKIEECEMTSMQLPPFSPTGSQADLWKSSRERESVASTLPPNFSRTSVSPTAASEVQERGQELAILASDAARSDQATL